MGLLIPPTVEKTLEVKQREHRIAVQTSVSNLFTTMRDCFYGNFERCWDNSDGLTPQEAFDALGSDAVELFRLAGILRDTLNAANPDTVSSDLPYEVTFNQDGTVTIGDAIVPVVEPPVEEPAPDPEPDPAPEP